MSRATVQQLTRLASEMSTEQRQVSPMQVAAQLLEEALGRVDGKWDVPGKENAHEKESVGPEEVRSVGGARAIDEAAGVGADATARVNEEMAKLRPGKAEAPRQRGQKRVRKRKRA
jgi:hypothetical protein